MSPPLLMETNRPTSRPPEHLAASVEGAGEWLSWISPKTLALVTGPWQAETMNRRKFLAKWIGGSAAASLVGLGFGGFIGLMGLHEGSVATVLPSGLVFGAVIAGTVGLMQGTLLADRLSGLAANQWAAKTGLGAMVAWGVIAYPIRELTAVDAASPSWTSLVLMAAGTGLAAGVIVAFLQWFELRRHLHHAYWSVPLLGIAWGVGSIVFFAANKIVEEAGSELVAVATAAGILLLVGAIVAAIQGFGLVRLLPPDIEPERPDPRARVSSLA